MKYKCNSYLDSYEYGKMSLVFTNKMWLMFSLYGSVYNLLLGVLIFILTKNIIDAVGFFLIIEVAILVLFRLKIREVAKLFYRIYLNKKIENNFILEFYKDYFIRKGKIDLKELYSDIDKCIETDTNFYLVDSKKDIIFILEKNECTFDLVNFIRKQFNNLDNQLGGKIIFKNKK